MGNTSLSIKSSDTLISKSQNKWPKGVIEPPTSSLNWHVLYELFYYHFDSSKAVLIFRSTKFFCWNHRVKPCNYMFTQCVLFQWLKGQVCDIIWKVMPLCFSGLKIDLSLRKWEAMWIQMTLLEDIAPLLGSGKTHFSNFPLIKENIGL